MITLNYDQAHLAAVGTQTTLLISAGVLLVLTFLVFGFLRGTRFAGPITSVLLVLTFVCAAGGGSAFAADQSRTHDIAQSVERTLAVKYGVILTDAQARTLVSTKETEGERVGGKVVVVRLIPTNTPETFRVSY